MLNVDVDGVVVGSVLVKIIEDGLRNNLKSDQIKKNLLKLNKNLACVTNVS